MLWVGVVIKDAVFISCSNSEWAIYVNTVCTVTGRGVYGKFAPVHVYADAIETIAEATNAMTQQRWKNGLKTRST